MKHPSVAQVMRPVTPEPFGFHDLALDGVDFRDLPHEDRSWDTVCFDPPYVPRMGSLPASRLEDVAYRERYGLDTPRSHREVVALMFAGLSECARVAQHYVLVKCCDYVTSRRLYLSHVAVVSEGERLGLRVHDLLVHGAGRGPGDGQIRQVRRSRRAHSYLVVFSVPSRPASTRAALRPPSSAPGSGAGSHP